MDDLTKAHCVPCEGGVPKMTPSEIEEYRKKIQPDWEVVHNQKLKREFRFNDFKESMAFVNKVADIANANEHHPDIYIFYSIVRLELWTHAIGGLFKNDFILAAKIERLLK